jgi:hypothetical protein
MSTATDVDRIREAKPQEPLRSVLNPNPGPEPGTMTTAARELRASLGPPPGSLSAPIDSNGINKCIRGGNNESYLRARLARDHPEIKARLDAREK